MKRKKDQENRVSEVCEPRMTYNTARPRPEMPTIDGVESGTTMPESRMSVDEYFNELWKVVKAKYENQ